MLHDPELHCMLYLSNSKCQLNPTHFILLYFIRTQKFATRANRKKKWMKRQSGLPFLVLTSFRASPGVQYLHLFPYPWGHTCQFFGNCRLVAPKQPKNRFPTFIFIEKVGLPRMAYWSDREHVNNKGLKKELCLKSRNPNHIVSWICQTFCNSSMLEVYRCWERFRSIPMFIPLYAIGAYIHISSELRSCRE